MFMMEQKVHRGTQVNSRENLNDEDKCLVIDVHFIALTIYLALPL